MSQPLSSAFAAGTASPLPQNTSIRTKIQSAGKSIRNLPCQSSRALSSFSKRLWRGRKTEEKKVVLQKSLYRSLLKCSIHLLPISATVTIAYFNLAGYFIGSSLQGRTGDLYQGLDLLCLQVTAKLLELLIVSSLGYILMDILRSQLLSGSDGLPLGILSSKQRFTEAAYLISPEFRFGLARFSQRRKRILFGLFLLTLSLISLFAGPSAALLLIPTQHDDWPAGGASLWLNGDDNSLWPSRLTASSIGGSQCEYVDSERLNNEALNFSGCVWAGASALAEAFTQRHFNDEIDLIIDDGVLQRNFVIRPKGEVLETWILAIHMAVGVMSKVMGQLWYQSVLRLPRSSTIPYRSRNQTVGSIQSWAPAVRTNCGLYNPIYSNESAVAYEYPDSPEYDIRLDQGYLIQINYSITTMISTQWIVPPASVPLNDNSSTTDVPSAFMNVIVPLVGSNDTGAMFTCSVDARWAMAVYHGGPVGDLDTDYVQSATIQQIRPKHDFAGYEYNFLPIDDGSWRRVRMDIEWLSALTPSLNDSLPGWTSLAALLTDMGMDNRTGLVVEWVDVPATLESVIATLVADGMSRQGYTANGGSSRHFTDVMNLVPWDSSPSSRQSLLKDTYSFPHPANAGTRLHWSVVIGGYAYRADSVAYYLALTVLFLYAALALGHVTYILWTRVCCDAWESFVGLIALTANSDAPGSVGTVNVFENASSGIERHRTMATKVRIRALPISGASAASQKDVKILFGDRQPPAEYKTLLEGEIYG